MAPPTEQSFADMNSVVRLRAKTNANAARRQSMTGLKVPSSSIGRVASTTGLEVLVGLMTLANDTLDDPSNQPVVKVPFHKKQPEKKKATRIPRSVSAPALESMMTVGPASATTLSSRHDTNVDPLINTCPVTYLTDLVKAQGFSGTFLPALELTDFFLPTSPEGIAGYSVEVITAIRQEDIEALKSIQESGGTLQCANKFGESIVHTACRRGSIRVLKFLLNEAGVSIRVCDDYGRTPLHDACWTREPQYELVATLIRECPDLLLVTDKRGCTPLSYARRDHWGDWCRFLDDHRDLLAPREFQ